MSARNAVYRFAAVSIAITLIGLHLVMAGNGVLDCGQPTKDGFFKVTVKCRRANGTIFKKTVNVKILASDTPSEKATKIADALDPFPEDPANNCFDANHAGGGAIDVVARNGCNIDDINVEEDGTAEPYSTTVDNFHAGIFRLFGGTTSGAVAITVPPTSAVSTTTSGKTVEQVVADLATGLAAAGVPVTRIQNQLVLTNLPNSTLGVSNTDHGLIVSSEVGDLTLAVIPTLSSWGIAVLALLLLIMSGWLIRRQRSAMSRA